MGHNDLVVEPKVGNNEIVLTIPPRGIIVAESMLLIAYVLTTLSAQPGSLYTYINKQCY